MNVLSYVAGAVQIGAVMGGAPLVVGLTRQVRARWEGRVGGGILQPWRDIVKQLGKQHITPLGTTVVFAAAPAIVAGSTLLIVAIAPLVATGSPLDASADLFTVVGLLFVGTVALTLAGIDTGTSFGGMGASREITIAALVEPTILLAVFALSIPAGSANLGALVANTITHPEQVVSVAAVLAFAALVIVNRRRDRAAASGQPGHSSRADDGARGDGPRIRRSAPGASRVGGRHATDRAAGAAGKSVSRRGASRAASPARLTSSSASQRWWPRSPCWRDCSQPSRVFVAKLRLFRVPELLAGSFLLALLAVTAANFFAVSP